MRFYNTDGLRRHHNDRGPSRGGRNRRWRKFIDPLTPAQRRELQHAANNPLGVVALAGPRGLRLAGWTRMMDRLCALGYAKPYVHGGYEITAAGRDALSEPR